MPANAAPAAEAAPAADTSITGDNAAPASQDQGGAQQQSSEAGDGGASSEAGQGAGNETTPQGGASASGDATTPGANEGADALGAPETYDFAMPDGFTLPDEMRDGLTTIAKAHNMNQAQAQALVDLGVKQATAISEAYAAKAKESPVVLADHWAQEWSKQTAADPELGGNEEKLNTTMALAGRVFATFASPALGEFLNKTGLAHHPELVRFMAKVGKAVSEDTLVTPSGGTKRGGEQPVDRDQRAASKLYPGMK